MLMPRKDAYRKQHRGRTKGLTKGGASLSYGEYGIQALEPGWNSARQIEASNFHNARPNPSDLPSLRRTDSDCGSKRRR